MGTNSYITHRMFVAALSHDEVTPANDVQEQRAAQPVRTDTSKDPWDAHMNVLAKVKPAARVWATSMQAARF